MRFRLVKLINVAMDTIVLRMFLRMILWMLLLCKQLLLFLVLLLVQYCSLELCRLRGCYCGCCCLVAVVVSVSSVNALSENAGAVGAGVVHMY